MSSTTEISETNHCIPLAFDRSFSARVKLFCSNKELCLQVKTSTQNDWFLLLKVRMNDCEINVTLSNVFS